MSEITSAGLSDDLGADVGRREGGATHKGSGHLAKPEPASGLGPAGECPSRKTSGFVCVDPGGEPYWKSAAATDIESLTRCFGRYTEKHLRNVLDAGWRCVPVRVAAQAIEARRPETQSGSVHESAVAIGDAPPSTPLPEEENRTRDDLREALARELAAMRGAFDIAYEWDSADALLAGPLAPILAQVSALQAEVERLQKATDRALRGESAFLRLATEAQERLQKVEGERDAAIKVQEMCAMSGGFWAKRAEAAEARLSALQERAERAEIALQSILKPYPAIIGPAEDMLEDHIAAVARFRAVAREVLAARKSLTPESQEKAGA